MEPNEVCRRCRTHSVLPSHSPSSSAHPPQVVVVSALRTPICKVWTCLPAQQTRTAHDCVPLPQAARGAFKSTTPDDLLLAVLRATAVQSGVAPSEVQDIAVGNVQLSGAYAGPASHVFHEREHDARNLNLRASMGIRIAKAPPPKKVPRRVSVRAGTPKGYQKTGFAAALADQVDLARTSILGKKVA